MWPLWIKGHEIMDKSPRLKYEAHQKHDSHNRKSTRLSVEKGMPRFDSLSISKLDKVFFLRGSSSLPNTI
jgi:hypothetical protein